MGGHEQACVIKASYGTLFPVCKKPLPENSLPNPGFDQVSSFGLIKILVFKDGVNIRFDVVSAVVGEVMQELI